MSKKSSKKDTATATPPSSSPTSKMSEDNKDLQKQIDQLKADLKTAQEQAAKVPGLEARVQEAESKSNSGTVAKPGDTSSGPSGPLTSTTAGSTWKGGARFQGGPQHYAMASDAFRMALDLKDRGDTRSFSMIFDQLFMEQRRTVGVQGGKKEPEGGYDSQKLMAKVFEDAKMLQDRGDDRPMGLIIADLSMRMRRGKVVW